MDKPETIVSLEISIFKILELDPTSNWTLLFIFLVLFGQAAATLTLTTSTTLRATTIVILSTTLHTFKMIIQMIFLEHSMLGVHSVALTDSLGFYLMHIRDQNRLCKFQNNWIWNLVTVTNATNLIFSDFRTSRGSWFCNTAPNGFYCSLSVTNSYLLLSIIPNAIALMILTVNHHLAA